MFSRCDSGIDLITQNLGLLYRRGIYVFSGEEGTGKTNFILRFLLKGLQEGETCLLVTSTDAKDVVINAESIGVDIASYVVEMRLIIYQFDGSAVFSAEHFFEEIAGVIEQNKVTRFALDPFVSANIDKDEIQSFAASLPSLLKKIEKLDVVSFISLGLPLSQELFTVKKRLEDTALGVFFLKNTSPQKTLVVKKLLGQPAFINRELMFTIQKTDGIKEIKKEVRVNYPKHKLGNTPAEPYKYTPAQVPQEDVPEAPARNTGRVSFIDMGKPRKPINDFSDDPRQGISADGKVTFAGMEGKAKQPEKKPEKKPAQAQVQPAPEVLKPSFNVSFIGAEEAKAAGKNTLPKPEGGKKEGKNTGGSVSFIGFDEKLREDRLNDK